MYRADRLIIHKGGRETVMDYPIGDGFEYQLEEFCRLLQEGKLTSVTVPPAHTVRALEIVERAIRPDQGEEMTMADKVGEGPMESKTENTRRPRTTSFAQRCRRCADTPGDTSGTPAGLRCCDMGNQGICAIYIAAHGYGTDPGRLPPGGGSGAGATPGGAARRWKILAKYIAIRSCNCRIRRSSTRW